MEQQLRADTHSPLRSARLAGLLAVIAAVVALLFLSPAGAQETPVPTDAAGTPVATPGAETPASTPGAQETPVDVTGPVLRIEADQAVQPVKSGDQFEVRILVDNVEHLSAFDFVLQYDRDRLEPVVAGGEGTPTGGVSLTPGDAQIQGELGEFIRTGERGQTATCQGPYTTEARPGNVLALCASLALPVCLGGPAGASGSGLLASVFFKSKGGEMTTLRLSSSNLVSDDAEPPCDPEGELIPQRIPHRVEDTTVLLSGGGGGSGLIIAVVAVVVVVALLAAGGGAYYWYTRRSTPAA